MPKVCQKDVKQVGRWNPPPKQPEEGTDLNRQRRLSNQFKKQFVKQKEGNLTKLKSNQIKIGGQKNAADAPIAALVRKRREACSGRNSPRKIL